jgi:hypothetical protein
MDAIATIAHIIREDMKVRLLTFEILNVPLLENQTIKPFTMGRKSFLGPIIFRSTAQDHSLEMRAFVENDSYYHSALSIVRTLCDTQVKDLMVANRRTVLSQSP